MALRHFRIEYSYGAKRRGNYKFTIFFRRIKKIINFYFFLLISEKHEAFHQDSPKPAKKEEKGFLLFF